jgi:RNA polymerase sigma factor (sigma-70 family)
MYAQAELIQGCLSNDRKMQKALYEQYKNAMYTICYRILNHQELAMEALQDGFINVFTHIKSFRADATLGAWIKTIVIRAAYKYLDESKLQFSSIDTIEDEAIVWPTTINPIDLEKAINSLPQSSKMIFLLAEVEGYAHKEIAELLNISIGTSKSQLHYAKSKLQKYLTA